MTKKSAGLASVAIKKIVFMQRKHILPARADLNMYFEADKLPSFFAIIEVKKKARIIVAAPADSAMTDLLGYPL